MANDAPIREALPTIRCQFGKGARLILIFHMGQPGGRRRVPALPLRPVCRRLAALLRHPVNLLDDCVGSHMSRAMKPRDVVLCEKLRFRPSEEANRLALAGRLATLAKVYVNDAFGACLRARGSIVSVPHRFHKAYASTCTLTLRSLVSLSFDSGDHSSPLPRRRRISRPRE